MPWNAQVVACVLWAVVGVASGVAAQPLWDGWHRAPPPSTIRYEVFKDKVVALTGLSKPCGLEVGAMGPLSPINGKIVKRNFADNGLKLIGIVIETRSGERLFINILAFEYLEEDMVDLADRSWIVQGLQTLLRQEINISGQVQTCGAAGRVFVLDSVHLAGNTTRPDTGATGAADTQPQGPPKSAEQGGTSVAMQAEGGTFVVPVEINAALTLNFTVDSGAADVSIPADVVMTLTRTGTLTSADFLGEQIYQLADGSRVPLQRFVIHSLKIGDKVLQNVNGSVAPAKGTPLLGQSFLSHFKSWSIDNRQHVLILN